LINLIFLSRFSAFFEKLQGFPVFSLGGQGNIALDADVGGAGGPAGCRAFFVNGENTRNGLGVLLIDCLSLGKTLVVVAGDGYGADLFTLPAAGAFCRIDEAGLLPDAGPELPRFALEIQKFGIRQKFDVQMPADLDQFRRDDSHGTVVGGKRLVEL